MYLLAGLALMTGCNSRPGDVTEIPSGYVGWVEIRYASNCAPAKVLPDGRRLLRVNARGRLCVGSRWEEGYARDEFYYVDAAGHRTPLAEETPRTGMIWGRSTRQYDLKPEPTNRFYVGTEWQYRNQDRAASEKGGSDE